MTIAQAVDGIDQHLKNDALYIANPIANANKLGGTERALLSFFGLVVGLSMFKATRKYAIWAGAVILILWGDKLYHHLNGA